LKTRVNAKGKPLDRVLYFTLRSIRFAFLDFETPEHATEVLTNPRNHYLNGRSLVMEFASSDAVRRGGYRSKIDGKGKEHAPGNLNPEQPPVHITSSPRARNALDTEGGYENIKKQERPGPYAYDRTAADTIRPAKRIKVVKQDKSTHTKRGPTAGRGGDTSTRTRPKPGAALAHARREQISIVPSQGKKIVF
jgi:RNA recognition motif-containing protein